MSIKRILLSGFRNHKNFIEIIDPGFVVINGPNGIGKTNILEAISLFSPGKGLRNAGIDEIFHPGVNEWLSSITFTYSEDELTLTMGSRIDNGKVSRQILKINDDHIKRSSELLNYLRVIWVTPQTDRIFLESPSTRRKFFDRITYNFFPSHALDMINYEKLLKSRLKLLQGGRYDDLWVLALEKQLSELNYSIYTNRKRCLQLINQALESNARCFLKPQLYLINNIDTVLKDDIEPIISIQEHLKGNRNIDAISGRTNFGIHKIDLEALHPTKNIKAPLCSTGENKAMLISIVLAQINAIRQISSTSIVLLLDDIFSHFDRNFRMQLTEELHNLNAQIWITTANSHIAHEITQQKYIINLTT